MELRPSVHYPHPKQNQYNQPQGESQAEEIQHQSRGKRTLPPLEAMLTEWKQQVIGPGLQLHVCVSLSRIFGPYLQDGDHEGCLSLFLKDAHAF